jgi:hypothetical protein
MQSLFNFILTLTVFYATLSVFLYRYELALVVVVALPLKERIHVGEKAICDGMTETTAKRGTTEGRKRSNNNNNGIRRHNTSRQQ